MQAASYLEIVFCVILMLWAGAFAVYKMKRPQDFLFPDVVFLMSILYFAFGPIVSYALGYGRSFEATWSVGEIFSGYIAITLFLLSLLVGSRLFRPKSLFRPEFTMGGRRSPVFFFVSSLNELKFVYIIVAFLIVWSLRIIHFKYGGGFSGSETIEVMLSVPYPIVILRQLFGLLYIVVVAYAVLQLLRPTRKNYLYLLFLLPEFMYQALQGRRDLLFLIILIAFVYYAIRTRINWKLIGACIFGVLFIFTAYSKFFLQFRSAAQADRSSIYSDGFFDTLAVGVVGATEADASAASERLSKNLMYRSRMNTDWILTITSSTGFLGALHGESLMHASFSALPRFLRPNKYWGDHASMIQAHLGMAEFDAADNYVANGYIDFGFLGVAIFGLGLAAMLNFGLLIAQFIYSNQAIFGCLIFAMLYHLALNVEVTLSEPLLVLRNMVVLFALCLALSAIGMKSGRGGRHKIIG